MTVAGVGRHLGRASAVSWLLLPKVEYLPTGNRNLVFGILLPPPGYNLDQLMAMGETVEDELRPYWDVDPGQPEARAARLSRSSATSSSSPAAGRCSSGVRGRTIRLRAGELVPLGPTRAASSCPARLPSPSKSSLFETGLDGRPDHRHRNHRARTGRSSSALGGQVLGQVQRD